MAGYHFIQPILHYVIFIFLSLMMPLPVISIDADQVRAQCINAFELAFPKQQWTSENDLRAFTANVSTERKEGKYTQRSEIYQIYSYYILSYLHHHTNI